MSPQEELQIIEKVKSGDGNAFEELVLANQHNVYNLALKLTKNEEDAQDVSQEAFFKAYTQLDSYRGESRFSVWMYRLTYNLCIDFLRKKPRAVMVPLTYQEDDKDEAVIEIPDLRNLPEDTVLRNELRKTINESINELAHDFKEILVMREISAMSYSDIAATLSINEGTVKSRLARARKNLINILVSKGTFPESFRLKDREEVEEHE